MLDEEENDHLLQKMCRYDFDTFRRTMPDVMDYAMSRMAQDEIGRYEMMAYYLDAYCVGHEGTDHYQFLRDSKDALFAQADAGLSRKIYDFLTLLRKNSDEEAYFSESLDSAILYWGKKIGI